MRTNLKVPFAEKDEAKKLGARWDAARKIWYVDGQTDMSPFSKWSPSAHAGSGGDEFAAKPASAIRLQATGKVIVGSEYVESARTCECLPWDVCDKCEAMALRR